MVIFLIIKKRKEEEAESLLRKGKKGGGDFSTINIYATVESQKSEKYIVKKYMYIKSLHLIRNSKRERERERERRP
jgi:hypothetical protein